jgi:SanA protein
MRGCILKIARLGAWALAALALVWLGCELAVEFAARGHCYTRLADIPKRDAAVVLGTSKFVAPGRPNLHYEYRLDAAAELFKAGKVERLIVSGNGAEPNYNEPRMMRADLIARGVPADRIVLDEGGMRTLDSVVRAADIYGARDCIIVSQRSHAERAIFIGRMRGQDILGWTARTVDLWTDPRTAIREHLARVRAVFDVAIHKQPLLVPQGKALSSITPSR